MAGEFDSLTFPVNTVLGPEKMALEYYVVIKRPL